MREFINGTTSLYEIIKMAAPQIGGMTTNYYVKRQTWNWNTVKKIGAMTYKKKKVKSYFSDCPLLIEKVNNKYFKGRSPYNLIIYFNENCRN